MSNPRVRERVAELVAPVCAERGLELVDVEFQPAGRRSLLRLTLDRPGGITIDDLAGMSREVGDLLDAHDAVPGSYTLQCSSPGVNRPLKTPEDFARYCGKRIRVVTREPVAGASTFIGPLVATRPEGIEIEDGSHGRVEIAFEVIRRAAYEHDFTEDLRAARS